MKIKDPVMVLDCHRGIYFGYLNKVLEGGNAVILDKARHCFYYSAPKEAGEAGVYSLATIGPQEGSKVGPRVKMKIRNVSKIVDVSSRALLAWESASWNA